MTREEIIQKASKFLNEDITEKFEEAEEKDMVLGLGFFYVSNSKNQTVRINRKINKEDELVYVLVAENIF